MKKSSDSSWQRVAHANLLGQLSKFRLGPLHIEDILAKVEEPSEPSLVRLLKARKLRLLKTLDAAAGCHW